MTVRDGDRQRLYDAETAAFGGTLLDEPLPWEEVEAVLHRVVHHPWWQSLAVEPPVLRRARRDAARSSSDGRAIRICLAGRTALTVAHELAHHLRPGDGHGPGFRAALLRTVAVVGGAEARAVLVEELSRHGLVVGPWAAPEPPDVPPMALGDAIAL